MASPLLIICVVAVSIILAASLVFEFYCEDQALKKSSKPTSKPQPHSSHSTSGKTPVPSGNQSQLRCAVRLEEPLSFITHVVGVSYDNDDGTSRQEILSECFEGEDVVLEQRWYNGKPAFAVVSDHGQIGYLAQDEATDFYNRYYRNGGEDSYRIYASISSIAGGTGDHKYGCWIRVEVCRI